VSEANEGSRFSEARSFQLGDEIISRSEKPFLPSVAQNDIFHPGNCLNRGDYRVEESYKFNA
jgi:hypothetical protein